MPIPSTFADLTPIASTNSPQGSESVKGTIDDYLRSHAALIRQLFDQLLGPTVTLASAATVNIGFAKALNIGITGTTTITAFDTIDEGTLRWVTFAGALTLTHDAAKLQLPGAANIQTAAGDAALFKSLGGGNWKCMSYIPIAGVLWRTGGTLSGPLAFNNNVPLQWKDTGGNARWVMSMDVANNIDIVNAGAGYVQILKQDGATPIQTWNNSGVATLTGQQVTKANAGNGTARILHEFQQSNGTPRFRFVIAATERQEIWTMDTAGAWTGAIGISAGGIQADGACTAPSFTGTSDDRLKKKRRRRPADFLARIAGLRKVGDFLWRKDDTPGIGGSAQELEAIWPQAVHTDERGFKSINYGGAAFVIAVELVRAFFAYVAKQARDTARLERRLAKLEGK